MWVFKKVIRVLSCPDKVRSENYSTRIIVAIVGAANSNADPMLRSARRVLGTFT
jgi:hypothetical protein